jgi:hypothetical protein
MIIVTITENDIMMTLIKIGDWERARVKAKARARVLGTGCHTITQS